jgi:S-DNA-T family DNA segregation ATPase FtsK/SpoIIIE
MSGTSAIIAGPAGSGRTTALATMARWLAGHDTPVIAVGVSRSALADGVVAAGGQLVGPDQVDRLRSLVAERPDSCLLIDDAERLADSEMEDVVLQWFKGSGSGRGALVVAGSSAEMTLAFRGLSVVARRSGQGILLGPTSYAEGELLGVRTPSAHAPSIPGRGLLVRAGQAIPVQVAL